MLEVKDLTISINGKTVLKKLNLKIGRGQTVILLGPNGAGKTSFLHSLLGFPQYKVKEGKIFFKGEDITRLPVNERVKRGIGIAFQNPPAIKGISLKDLVGFSNKNLKSGEIKQMAMKINMDHFLNREVNLGFSGGEIKRSEIFQLTAQRPDLVILDEPDSGVDVENIELVGKAVSGILKEKSGLIITHLGYILNFIKADLAYVLYKGKIACQGEPRKILKEIMENGYSSCAKCV